MKYLARSSRVSVRERSANEKLSTEVCGSVVDGPEPWVCADMIDFAALSTSSGPFVFPLFVRHLDSLVDMSHDRNHTIYFDYCSLR